MIPFFVAIFLLGLSSLATAANFNQVFALTELDYEWPSEASRAQALRDGTFKPENVYPRYMAVYGTRLFLSLHKDEGIPVTLVSLPTSSASPKLTPFPSRNMHGPGDCDKIEEAKGLEVDSVGRLWVLDQGSISSNCSAKLLIIDLANKDQIKIIHRFPFRRWLHDLVLDETPDGTFAYITRSIEQNIVVFSLERNESWMVDTPGIRAYAIALSPKDQEARQLYLSEWNSNQQFSVSVAALRNGTRTANLNPIGNWTAISSFRMLMDNHGTMYAAFFQENHIFSCNTSQPFQEQRFHQVAGVYTGLPFTFALDQSGTFWMTVFDDKKKPRYRLLKATVGAKSYTFEASQE
ncbi:protein yellow-like isoform X2 [Cloeon dipterum]|uniref:protein yellow-like isoform X2 n=1 Tax=Cloeon dipterum TaxID=197152 RepID=UPI00322024E0